MYDETVSRSDPIAFLAQESAQLDVLDGLRAIGSDWHTLYAKCPRGDWLLGIAIRLGVDRTMLMRAAIGCARTALEHYEGEEAARVLDLAERFTRGEATAAEVADASARLDAAAARAVDPSTDAAARAVSAVALAIADDDTDVLASAAAFAAEATMVATMDCGLAMAMGWAHGKTADAVRAAIPFAEVERCTKVA